MTAPARNGQETAGREVGFAGGGAGLRAVLDSFRGALRDALGVTDLAPLHA